MRQIIPLLFCTTLLASDPSVLPKGFEHFYNLEFDEAVSEFQEMCRQSPENPQRWNHLAQGVLYQAMLRAGALESEIVSSTNAFLRRPKMNASAEAAKEFELANGKAIQLAQTLVDKNARDTAALYALGLAYGLRANWTFLVRRAWIDSLRDAT